MGLQILREMFDECAGSKLSSRPAGNTALTSAAPMSQSLRIRTSVPDLSSARQRPKTAGHDPDPGDPARYGRFVDVAPDRRSFHLATVVLPSFIEQRRRSTRRHLLAQDVWTDRPASSEARRSLQIEPARQQ